MKRILYDMGNSYGWFVHLQKGEQVGSASWLDVGMGERKGGQFYVFTLLHISEHSEHFSLVQKIN